ncbi:MAG: hypothetical protein KKD18_06945 [Nanoarchaeota archaeon]|nr:hypothetical protein [Nanoarchaeota archaeon]MBU0978129.1 hypothetical protein [Nanoarchaeota archaeon]
MAKKQNIGLSLDDAFADDEDVEYAKPKPKKKLVQKLGRQESFDSGIETAVKGSKPIGKIKKGDKIKVDGLILEVDAHVVLIDHGTTKEMAIECFDPKADKDYQIRYFDDQVDTSIEVYSLEEIVYSRMKVRKIEW